MIDQTAQIETIDNGLTVLTESVTGRRPVALGFWARSGSAHEPPELAGVTHFMEHMLFRGTRRRTGQQIDRAMAAVGGDVNGFAEREYTCFHARCLSEHIGLAADIIADMLLDSLFRPADIRREISIVSEEIAAYEDAPADVVSDLIAEAMWGEHPLARRVFGSLENMERITSERLREEAARRFSPSRLVVAAAGDISHRQIVDELAAHFEGQAPTDAEDPLPPLDARSRRIVVQRSGGPVYLRLGAPGFERTDDRRFAARITCGALGGGPSSRLFRKVREEQGLAYDVGAYSATYSCGGSFVLYAATGAPTVPDVLGIFRQELHDIAANGLTPEELDETKQQFICQSEIALDHIGARMERLADSYIHHGRVIPVQESLDRIRSVTMDDIVSVAQDMFGESDLAIAAIGPVDEGSLEAA